MIAYIFLIFQYLRRKQACSTGDTKVLVILAAQMTSQEALGGTGRASAGCLLTPYDKFAKVTAGEAQRPVIAKWLAIGLQ